ncbi:MAG: hypothetical protein GKS07_11010 [Nitrosopumilus sp.]|nr:MAG: hypothetical protein GKS07_00575 [Nitrosopumilus sp.]QMU55371.1 MAG: hypothetical protein GKS07_11010 [Nitrosopumilus sp.]
MSGQAIKHLENIDVNDIWETQLCDLMKACFHYHVDPKIDVFASFDNAKLDHFINKEMDAFKHELLKDAFANPPYSIIKKCMKFLYEQHVKHNIEIIILAYSKTDTKWWHDFVEGKAEVHFIKGRLKFQLEGIIPRICKECKQHFIEEINYCPNCSLFEPVRLSQNCAPYPSCWIIYRKRK